MSRGPASLQIEDGHTNPYHKEGCGCLVLLGVSIVVFLVLLATSPRVAGRFDRLLIDTQYALAHPLCVAPNSYVYDPHHDEPDRFILAELPEAAVMEHLAGVDYHLERVAVDHHGFPANARVWAQVMRSGEPRQRVEYSLIAGQNLRFELEGLMSDWTLCAYGLGRWRITQVQTVSDDK